MENGLESYCFEMQKAALLYAIYPFQKYKFTHHCKWDIDWKKLDRIHSYTFTSGLTKKTIQHNYVLENPLSQFVTRVFLLSICFSVEGSWDAPLSSFRELGCHWMIYILLISESQDSLPKFMAN